ncbi:hypothetical protein J5N97_029192 [Dioscorea zingiberensis]|uniref:Uncharacterized protein n=1 Tax=Dioscorea zingiberensis TaxID=325984 RepID=A0A9D5C092_9LILI|nr:hypothetical protein J5N97_029192 [Dioscorea zingiberensis]
MEQRQACSTAAVPTRRRSLLSFRRNQVVSMDQQSHDHELQEHDLFHSNVSQLLLSLLHEHNDDHLLTIPFLSKLIQAFLCCEEEFRSLLHNSLACNPSLLSRPPLDRLLPDHLDRAVKSLDVFNAVTQTLESLRQLHRQADIAVSALLHRPPSQLGQAQLNRAKRALTKLFTHTHPSSSFRRGCSFTNHRITGDVTTGLALSLQTMNSILTFLIWTLMSAFTGTSAGPAPPLVGLQERIWEELKKKKNGGVLLELQVLEKCSRAVLNAMEGCGDCCKDEMQMRDVAEKGVELGEACQRLNVGLGMFERLLREVFHRTVKSRGELQQCLDQSCRSSSSSAAASFPL